MPLVWGTVPNVVGAGGGGADTDEVALLACRNAVTVLLWSGGAAAEEATFLAGWEVANDESTSGGADANKATLLAG